MKKISIPNNLKSARPAPGFYSVYTSFITLVDIKFQNIAMISSDVDYISSKVTFVGNPRVQYLNPNLSPRVDISEVTKVFLSRNYELIRR